VLLFSHLRAINVPEFVERQITPSILSSVLDQSAIPFMVSSLGKPLCLLDGYAMYPLSACTENTIATTFAKICQRGNQLLQGKPTADLIILGRALYRKSVTFPASSCFLHGPDSECVAFVLGWDAADGGIWDDDVPCPASLASHSAVATAVLACVPVGSGGRILPNVRGEVVYSAFGGVCLGHPAWIFAASFAYMFRASERLGFCTYFAYMHHPKLIRDQEVMRTAKRVGPSPSTSMTWKVVLSDIVAPEEVHAELCLLEPGYAYCFLESIASHVRMITECCPDRKMIHAMNIAIDAADASI